MVKFKCEQMKCKTKVTCGVSLLRSPEKNILGLFHVPVRMCSVHQRGSDKISAYGLAAVIDTVQFITSVKFLVKTRTRSVME